MRKMLTAAALLAVGIAHAQVFKCPGPGGRAIFTDVPCADGKDLGSMQRNAVAAEPVPELAPPPPRPAAAPAPMPPQPVAEPLPVAPAGRARSASPNITTCDPTGCWDTSGNRYNRGAAGTFLRQDGAVCQQVGNRLQCN